MERRLIREQFVRQHRRADRPMSISSALVTEGIELRLLCQFIGSSVRALNELPGGVVMFLPCNAGTHVSRHRLLAWDQCSLGLTHGLWVIGVSRWCSCAS